MLGPGAAHDWVVAELERTAADAFCARNEAVNLKKVLACARDSLQARERELCQLALFWYVDEQKDPASPGLERSLALSRALLQCRGYLDGVLAARQALKWACSMPRHSPDFEVPYPVGLLGLPWSLACHGKLAKALAFAAPARTPPAAAAPPPPSPLPPPPPSPAWAALSDGVLRGPLAPLEARFVERLLMARGTAKALRIREELGRICATMAALGADAREALKRLDVVLAGEPPLSHRQRAKQHYEFSRGALASLGMCLRWVEAAAAATAGSAVLFVAGDSDAAHTTTAFVGGPQQQQALPAEWERLAATHRAEMQRVVASEGWPPPSRALAIQGKRRCGGGCGGSYGRAWVRDGVCCMCECAARAAGRCPFGKCQRAIDAAAGGTREGSGGSGGGWCQHFQRCLSCDQGGWPGCAECGLWSGDGEEALRLARSLRPTLVCLDFDRTLASTRAGAIPEDGRHSCDASLLEVLRLGSDGGGGGFVAHVVTRNSHAKEIAAFLRTAGGVAMEGRVHSIGRKLGTTKADVILRLLGEAGGRALFVDDDVREVISPRLLGDARVDCVLFGRSAG